MHFLAVALDQEDTQQIHESATLHALSIEEHLNRLTRQVGRAVDMDLLLPDRQGLQGGEVGVARSLDPLAPLPRAKSAGQLGECKDPLAVQLAQLLLAQASEEAYVVGLLRFPAAPLAELAPLAVAVQYQPGRLAPRLETFDLVQHLPGLA